VKVDKLNTLKGVKRSDVQPQDDKYVLPNGRTIYLLAEGERSRPAVVRDVSSRTPPIDGGVNRHTLGACAPLVNLGCANRSSFSSLSRACRTSELS